MYRCCISLLYRIIAIRMIAGQMRQLYEIKVKKKEVQLEIKIEFRLN